MTENEKKAITYANALRALASYVEANAHIPCPASVPCPDVYGVTLAEFKLLALVHGVKKQKDYWEDRFMLRVQVPFQDADNNEQFIRMDYSGDRGEVCQRIVTGERVVEEKYIPGRLEPAHTEEIVEWKCNPILATLDEVPES
jgi:hypothetical protein